MRFGFPLPAVFALDLRSLALFRFALGALVSLDCWSRLCGVGAFYSDAGILPRTLLLSSEHAPLWSLALLNGTALFQAALLVIAALAAAAFALGYRSRQALLLCWLVVVSLQVRNPLVLGIDDQLMAVLLFWSLFVPLSSRWSVDAALSPQPPPPDPRHLSWGGASLFIQLLSLLLFTTMARQDPAWWPDGSALYYVLSLDHSTRELGRALLAYPELLQGLSYALYGSGWLIPLALLSPWATQTLRHLAFVILALLQIGTLLSVDLGLLPWLTLAALSLLLGPGVWAFLSRRPPRSRPLRIYYDEDCVFCLRSCLILRSLLLLPADTEILPAQRTPRARALMEAQWSWVVIDHEDAAHLKWAAMVALIRDSHLLGWSYRLFAWRGWNRPGDAVYDWVATHRGRLAAVVVPLLSPRPLHEALGTFTRPLVIGLLLLSLSWHLAGVGALPAGLQTAVAPPLRLLKLDAAWTLWAPSPATDDGWFVMPGQLEDGRSVDLLSRAIGAPRFDRPAAGDEAQFADARWARYHHRLWSGGSPSLLAQYGRYRCQEWNQGAVAGQRLQQFSLDYMLDLTPPPGGSSSVERRVIWRQSCLPEPPRPGPDGEDVEGLDDGPEAG
jgi:predicted DCC family thiol-disulfide oxidoreductase YuxK